MSNWYAMKTHIRMEITLANRLGQIGIEVYCPIITDETSNKPKPLLPGYIFVKAEPEKLTELKLQHNGLEYHLETDGIPSIVTDDDMKKMRQTESIYSSEHKEELHPGSTIIINSGPFKGLDGVVEKIANRGRVVVNLDVFGENIPTEIDITDLKDSS